MRIFSIVDVIFFLLFCFTRCSFCAEPNSTNKVEDLWEKPDHLQADIDFLTRSPLEPNHDKTYKMACASSEDSDQPGHPPSLIRGFAVHMKKPWVLSYPFERTVKTLIRLGGCPGWSESSLGAQSFCWFCHEVEQLGFEPMCELWWETKN